VTEAIAEWIGRKESHGINIGSSERTTWLEIRDFGPYFHTLHNAYFPISLLHYSGRRISKIVQKVQKV
jgi:hypothetical protein